MVSGIGMAVLPHMQPNVSPAFSNAVILFISHDYYYCFIFIVIGRCMFRRERERKRQI